MTELLLSLRQRPATLQPQLISSHPVEICPVTVTTTTMTSPAVMGESFSSSPDSMFSVEGVAVGVATTSSQIKLQFARIISGPAKSLASCPVQTPTEFSFQPLPGPHWSMLRLQLMLPPCGRGLCKTLPGHICLETPGLSGTKHLIQVTTKC